MNFQGMHFHKNTARVYVFSVSYIQYENICFRPIPLSVFVCLNCFFTFASCDPTTICSACTHWKQLNKVSLLSSPHHPHCKSQLWAHACVCVSACESDCVRSSICHNAECLTHCKSWSFFGPSPTRACGFHIAPWVNAFVCVKSDTQLQVCINTPFLKYMAIHTLYVCVSVLSWPAAGTHAALLTYQPSLSRRYIFPPVEYNKVLLHKFWTYIDFRVTYMYLSIYIYAT